MCLPLAAYTVKKHTRWLPVECTTSWLDFVSVALAQSTDAKHTIRDFDLKWIDPALATDLHRPQKKLPALGAEDLEAVRQDLANRGGGVGRSGDTRGHRYEHQRARKKRSKTKTKTKTKTTKTTKATTTITTATTAAASKHSRASRRTTKEKGKRQARQVSHY